MPCFVSPRSLVLSAAAAVCLAATAAPAFAQMDTASCLSNLRRSAVANGVSVADFDRYTSDAQVLESTVASAKAQPEGRETWWDYIAKTVDAQRVNEGKAILQQYGAQLEAIGRNYSVDKEALVAIFGIETNYGTQLGKVRVVDAWITRACTERNPLWAKNAFASIRLLRDGTVAPDTFVGSWSGAFGMTQFIPTSFYELAADGDGDGRIDLYQSLPDALASTANHLLKRRARWTRGLDSIIEVRVPPAIQSTVPTAVDAEYSNASDRRSLRTWAAQGVTRVNGQPLSDAAFADTNAFVFAPTGSQGPIFLATENFEAILHYNQSRKYGLSVSLLLNQLKGEPPLVTPWPTDDPGLSRAEIRELQTLLVGRGYAIGTPDGIPGTLTRTAVRQEQEAMGVPTDGRVGMKMLLALRQRASMPAPTQPGTSPVMPAPTSAMPPVGSSVAPSPGAPSSAN